MSSSVANKIPRIVMPICDSNLYTLKMSSYLFDRFWPSNTKIDVVGFTKPDFEISKKMNFVSMDSFQKGGANSWSKYICEYLNTIDDKHIIFILEDFFPTASPNFNRLNHALTVCRHNELIGRFDISIDTYTYPGFVTVANLGEVDLIEKPKWSNYRISTQPSVWSRSFLITILSQTTTPWDFEINGSIISNNYNYRILAFGDSTYRNFPSYWIHKGAVSRFHEGKVNVLGLDIPTIKDMVKEGLLEEEKLQWGQWNGPVPSFCSLGGYDFDLSRMPRHEASLTNWEEYKHIYEGNKNGS